VSYKLTAIDFKSEDPGKGISPDLPGSGFRAGLAKESMLIRRRRSITQPRVSPWGTVATRVSYPVRV